MSLKIWLPLNGNIENQGTLNTTSRLPSGYTEVEYLQSSGTQWINTNDKLTSDFKMVYSINVQNGGSDSAMPWASYATGNRYDCQFLEHTAIWFQRAGGTLYRGNLDGTILNKDLYIEESLNSVSVNGKVYGTGSFTFTQNNVNVGLFNSPGSNYQSANKCRIFKWFAGNTLKHCFIPCYRNSDNKPGMYDTVTGTFYTNAGSGEFSVGPVVITTVINNNVTFVDGGKIGQKCASFNNNYFSLQNLSNFNTISVSFWMKPSNTSQVGCLLNYRASVGEDLAIFLIDGKIRFDAGGITVFNYTYTTDWQHIIVTYDGNVKSLYINGILNQSVTINKVISCSATKGTVGASSVNTTSGSSNNYIGLLNDYRIYDECLSAEEIKEISRGMVLHYKMCQPERGENLLANGAATEITCRSKNPDYPLKAIRTTLENNTQYTLSFDAKSDNGLGTFYCSLANGGSSQIYFATKIKPTTKYKHYIYTVTRGTQSVNNILFAAYYNWSGNANVTDTIHIKNVKLEKGSNPSATFSPPPTETLNWGTIEYDGSGYKNHGTVSGNVTLSADSPRYTGSYTFNGNDTSILIGDLSKLIPDGNFTMSCWIKKSEFSSKGYDTIFGGPYGFELESKNDTANERKFCAHNWGGGKWDYEFNKWYHLVMVRTSSDTKFYFSPESGFNNTPVITGDPGSIPSGNYYVGSWRSATEQNYKGLISDFRIYATALDATDVAELYKLGK